MTIITKVTLLPIRFAPVPEVTYRETTATAPSVVYSFDLLKVVTSHASAVLA
jgi:BarA-like signal transduction histidine kinase